MNVYAYEYVFTLPGEGARNARQHLTVTTIILAKTELATLRYFSGSHPTGAAAYQL